MDGLILIGLLIINLGISFWNAKVCGQSWVEAKAVGGFIRVLIWCGAIQAAIGFSMVLIVIILFLRKIYPEDFSPGYISLNLTYAPIERVQIPLALTSEVA